MRKTEHRLWDSMHEPADRRRRRLERVGRRLGRAKWPRLTMTAIMILTWAAWFLSSAGLLRLGVDSMATAYPLAVGIAYLAFLGMLWAWLKVMAFWQSTDGRPFLTHTQLRPEREWPPVRWRLSGSIVNRRDGSAGQEQSRKRGGGLGRGCEFPGTRRPWQWIRCRRNRAHPGADRAVRRPDGQWVDGCDVADAVCGVTGGWHGHDGGQPARYADLRCRTGAAALFVGPGCPPRSPRSCFASSGWGSNSLHQGRPPWLRRGKRPTTSRLRAEFAAAVMLGHHTQLRPGIPGKHRRKGEAQVLADNGRRIWFRPFS